jgi:hypothetical protein
MYKDFMIVNRDDMLDITQSAFKENVYVFFVSEYDIRHEYKSFKCEELIDKLINEMEFKIIY